MRTNTFVKTIAFILVVAVLVGVFMFVRKYTDGFKTDFKTFYVKIDEQAYYSTTSNMYFEGKVTFDVEYTFGKLQGDNKADFDYVIEPIADFTYIANGTKYSFADITNEELATLLSVKKGTSSLTVSFPSTIAGMLAAHHGCNVDAVIVGDIGGDIVRITFVSEDGSSKIRFDCFFADILNIRLSPTGIVL